MRIPHRSRVVVGAAVGSPIVLAALAWWWWLPAAVRGRVEEAARHRLGMQVTVGGASMRLRGVVLEDLRLQGRDGGVSVEVDELGVRAGLFALAFEGAAAIEALQARGVRVTADLSDPGAESSLRAMREALEGDGAASSAGAGGREIEAVQVSLEVADAHGPLIRVAGGEARRDGAGLVLGADAVDVGGGEGHRVSLGGAEARVVRGDGGDLQIAAASAAGGEVVWASPPAPEQEPADDERPPRTLERLLRMVELVRPAGGADEAEGAGPEGPGWIGRLAPGATLRLANAAVRTRTENGEETILQELRAAVERRDGARLHFEGEGTPASGGALSWNLDVEPLALRAEGTVAFEGLPLALVTPFVPDVPWHEPERGRLDGELTVAGEAAEPLSIQGRLTVRDAALYSPRIAPEPVGGITFTVDGEGTWDSDDRRLTMTRGTLTMGGTSAQLSGTLEWTSEHYLVDFTATLPSTDCGTAVGAIPRDLLADLAGFSWQGQLGGRIVARVDSRALEQTHLDIDVFDACRFETVPRLADLRRVRGPFLHRVLEPDGTWFEMTTGPGTGNWTSIYATSPFLVQAVLAHEDPSFFRHGGFAPWAIEEALKRNLEEGRYVIGASTITMQLAKNLFLHREKTLARKVQEVLLTWWLEKALEKRDILELYLNVIEYGPGIYGIRNAAWHYFGRDPSELSPAESVFLANILPNPKLYHHQYERGELSNSMRNRMERLLRHMHARGRIDEEALEYGLAEIEAFSFHREGDPPPGSREIAGSTAPLPFEPGTPVWDDRWEQWEEERFPEETFEDAVGLSP